MLWEVMMAWINSKVKRSCYTVIKNDSFWNIKSREICRMAISREENTMKTICSWIDFLYPRTSIQIIDICPRSYLRLWGFFG